MASPDGNVGQNGTRNKSSGSSYNDPRSRWSIALLREMKLPVTPDNIRFINAWQQAEGTRASFNPLATTMRWNGATTFNSVGVRNYASYEDGIKATAATLRLGYYTTLVSAMRSGKSAVSIASNIDALKTWGTGRGVLNVLTGGGGGAGTSAALDGSGGIYGGGDDGNPDGKLSAADLDNYSLTKAIIRAVPELWNIWQTAIEKGWNEQQFGRALKNSKWYKNHDSAQRAALYLKNTDPAEYEKQLHDKTLQIKQAAAAAGAVLTPAQLEKIAGKALTGGWSDEQLQATLSHYVEYVNGSLTGNAGEAEDALRQHAADMGVRVSDNWVLKQARHLVAGTSTLEQATDYLNKVALSSFPGLADYIKSGQTVKDVASPYLQGMASTLELNPDSIDLFDPTIRKALSSVDAKGNAALTPLWQFEAQLKKDPRWLQTNNARDDLMSTTRGLLQAWGLSI